MSSLFDDADGGPASLFAPIKSKSETKDNSSQESKTGDALPSLFSLSSKKASKKSDPTKNKKDTKEKSKDTSNEAQKEDKKALKKKKDSKKSKKNKEKKDLTDKKDEELIPEQPIQENSETNKDQTQIPKSKPKQKKVVKKVVVRRNNAQDIAKRTLNHIQNEITEQFAELFTTVESLLNDQKQASSSFAIIPNTSPTFQSSYRPKFDIKAQKPLTNDEILIRLQEAISDSLDKDKVLQDEQVSIKKMVSTLTLTEEEEKSQLRKKIADLMETIAAEAANTADSQSEHEFRANEISRLRIELENVPKHYASIEGKLRAERDEEIQTARQEYETVRYNCEDRIKKAKDKVRFFNQQISLEGSKMANMATEKDLRRAVEESKKQLKDVVKNVALSVKDFVDNKVSKDKKYGGAIVRKVAMIALKRAMNHILNPDEEDENEEIPEGQSENEAEEEEEEAEDPENVDEDDENQNEEENNENNEENNENEEENNENEEENNENEEENNENDDEEAGNEEEGEADDNEGEDANENAENDDAE